MRGVSHHRHLQIEPRILQLYQLPLRVAAFDHVDHRPRHAAMRVKPLVLVRRRGRGHDLPARVVDQPGIDQGVVVNVRQVDHWPRQRQSSFRPVNIDPVGILLPIPPVRLKIGSHAARKLVVRLDPVSSHQAHPFDAFL